MKRCKYILVFILLANVFYVSFAFTPHRIEPVDIRADGMGGAYLTDSESFYTLFSNPAGLAFVGEKRLRPTWLSIKRSKKEVALAPLTFGAIKNNFGWSVINSLFIVNEGDNFYQGPNLALVFGYSLPIDFGVFGTLSIGVSGRGIAQVQTDSLLFLELFVPHHGNKTLGFGFDVGIQYEVLDFINIAVVLQDAYTALWTKTFRRDTDKTTHDPFEYAPLEPKLGIGVGFDLPVAGIISHLGIHIEYNNLWPLFKKDGDSSNPLLELSVGAEIVLFDVFSVRLGMLELGFMIGLGLNLNDSRIDICIGGRGFDDLWKQSSDFNFGISITREY